MYNYEVLHWSYKPINPFLNINRFTHKVRAYYFLYNQLVGLIQRVIVWRSERQRDFLKDGNIINTQFCLLPSASSLCGILFLRPLWCTECFLSLISARFSVVFCRLALRWQTSRFLWGLTQVAASHLSHTFVIISFIYFFINVIIISIKYHSEAWTHRRS